MSQPEIVLHHLETRGGITAMSSFSRYGITQLARVIADIERRGKRVERVWLKRNNKRFVSYRLAS